MEQILESEQKEIRHYKEETMSKNGNFRALTRRTFLKYMGSGVIAVAGTYLFSTSTTLGRTNIKLGVLTPGETELGISAKAGASFGTELVNGKFPDIKIDIAKWDGIPNLNNAKVELIFADHGGDPKQGANLVEELKTKGAIGIVGAFDSQVIAKASQAADELSLPLIDATSTDPYLTRRDLKYYFRLPAHLIYGIQLFFKLAWRYEIKQKDFLYLAQERTGLPKDIELMKEVTENLGFNLSETTLKSGITVEEMKTKAQEIKAMKPDAIIYDLPADLIAVTCKQMSKMPEETRPPAVVVDPYASMKAKLLEMLDQKTWNKTAWSFINILFLPISSDDSGPAPAISSQFKTSTDKSLDSSAALALTGVQTLATMMNKAGSTEPQGLVEAASELSISSPQLVVPWMGVDFEVSQKFGDVNQNIMSSPMVARLGEDGNYKKAGVGGVAPLGFTMKH